MNARELTLQGTLTAQQQYVIPIFQRYYTWEKKNWEQLWSDIAELREKPGKRHFMGALVFVSDKAVSYSYPTYEVIDGQQRIITFSLLLAALRNVAAALGDDEGKKLAEEITNSVLVHPYKQGAERFRVFPRQLDREDFKNAVLGPSTPTNRIGKALKFFADEISEDFEDADAHGLRGFYNLLLGGLDFVHINLDGENPYKIFRSLNSTGVDLSQADLIRNFVFTNVPISEQDDFDKQLWTPLESRFSNDKTKEVNSREVSNFLRDFLMTSGSHIAPADTFEEFETRYKSGFDARTLAVELTAAADLYDTIRGAKPHPIPDIDQALNKFRQLDSSTAYPLILKLMDLMSAGKLDAQQFAECIELVTGFIFRRYACGETSRTYSKWFVAACNEVNEDSRTSLERFLVEKGFPGNARFESALVKLRLYAGRYDFAVLQQLERSFGSKEAPNPDNATIEHIMPQTLSREWRDDLGPDARQIHDDWIDTLGNLTFTGYNTGLSNKRFSVKMDGIGDTPGYRKSNFELTKNFLHNEKWGAAEIEGRGQELARRATAIWIGPAAVSDAEAEGRPENPFNQGSTRFKLFNLLGDGQWRTVKTIQEQYKWNVQSRVDRLKAYGAKTGRWTIEQVDGKVRMTWPDNFVPLEGDDGLSEYRQVQLKYWTAFYGYMQQNSEIRCQKPGARNWITHTIGYGGVTLASVMNSAADDGLELRAELVLHGTKGKARFDKLFQHRQEVEAALGESLIWYKPDDKMMCCIYFERSIQSLSQELWPEQHTWLCEHLGRLLTTFKPFLDGLVSEELAQGASA